MVGKNNSFNVKQRRPSSSVASWAFRFAGSCPGVLTVLSGMAYMEHLQDNLRTYSPLDELTDDDKEFLEQTAQLMLRYPTIPCNDCKYCMPCPYGLDIPAILLHYNKCVNEGNVATSSQDENYRRARRAFLVGYDRSVPKLRQASHCIGCNQCSFVCPHAAIRPFLMTEAEAAAAPEGYQDKEIKAAPGYKFNIVVSVMDCLGCGSCTHVCPKEALTMTPFDDEEYKAALWDYVIALPAKKNPMDKNTVIGSQFEQPLLEFSGACAGCAETPYCKVVTQLFGDRMMVANAHGCSSVWGGSAPDCGYTKNSQGHGPAWSTSLFEDNAEYGFGMFLAEKAERNLLEKYIDDAMDVASPKLQEAFKDWKEQIGRASCRERV